MGKTARIAIVADDLTGACDAALEFFNRGAQTVVLLTADAHDESAEVLALNTASRNCSPQDAYERTLAAFQQLRAASARPIYKKIDSALRGNVRSALRAVCDADAPEAVLVAPSLPHAGRIVEHGILRVNGEPLAASPIGREHRRSSSRVNELIAETTAQRVATIGIASVRAGNAELTRQIQAVVSQGTRILALDAVTDSDLDVIAAVLGAHPHWRGAGSAGLAGALARQQSHRAPTPVNPMPKNTAPILAVIGSQHPTARAQLEWLEQRHCANVIRLDSIEPHPMSQAKVQVQEYLHRGNNVVLAATRDIVSDAHSAQRTACGMGELVANLDANFSALVLCGGDTAQGVLSALRAESAQIVAQVEPGMPALVLRGGRYAGMPIVTKAGSFGYAASLGAAFEFLHSQ